MQYHINPCKVEGVDANAVTPTEVFARQLRVTRNRKGWTQAQLADRMQELGFEGMDQPMVARSERGKRTVSLDEVLGFALALGVAPMFLVLPEYSDVEVRVALGVARPANNVAAWWRGADPLLDAGVPRDAGERFFISASTEVVSELKGEAPEIPEIYTAAALLVSFGLTYQTEFILRTIANDARSALLRLGRDPDRPIADVFADQEIPRRQRIESMQATQKEH